MFNPFPGLRPFEPDESHLFFGREKEIDDLLRRLRSSRFVAVVGTSGSGKSSLVRSGLIPSLQSGFMAGAGSSWRIAMMRPGEDPIGHLAAALDTEEVLRRDIDLADTNRVLIEVTLRRSTLGLVQAVRQAQLPQNDNVLVIVDQFEELFRFSESFDIVNSRDEAIAFVRLLLEATAQSDAPIYVVLTMRSDFIGDCMNYPALPEAVNAGLYLVGRMSRESLRSAITGPVAVAGGAIAPRLVNRVLNDLGDDQDLLPLVQHALMRTWDHWSRSGPREDPIDVEDYEAVGTFRNALSKHVEEAYEEAAGLGHGETTERVFKALTDAFADPRGVRRPTSVAELAAITEASEASIIHTVDIFRRHGRSFLMPPATVPLTNRTIVDLSHESLMRCWDRLITWTEEERAAAAFYLRLSQAAAWFEEGAAGLWRNPELELAQRWTVENEPTAAWARRYAPGFERAMTFLDRSLKERDRQNAELERERRAKLRRTQFVAAGLATGLMVAAGLGMFAWTERQRARSNLALARSAVDESLAAAERDPSQTAADPPQVTELRRELLSKAERFYVAFMDQEPRNEEMRRDVATAHVRLGHINRLLEKNQDAEREYREAITGLAALVSDNPSSEADRAALATAFNSMGETLRRQVGRTEEARSAYESALQIQRALVKEQPGWVPYQEELARTLSNRGILRYNALNEPAAAEADFRDSIRLLEPLTGSTRAHQEIGRVSNNLAAVLESRRGDDARTFYERAVSNHTQLVAKHPDNREYKLELATFTNNLAMFLHDSGDIEPANEQSLRAVELINELARPTASLAIERADSHNLRGVILQTHGAEDALQAFDSALNQFRELQRDPVALHMRKFHERFGDLLVNLAQFSGGPAGDEQSRRLLARGVDQYADIARRLAESGTVSQSRAVLDTLDKVIPQLGESSRRSFLSEVQDQLRRTLDTRGPS